MAAAVGAPMQKYRNNPGNLSDYRYKQVMEGSATYNARLCSERKLRLPFLDSQTGVAQNHSNLFLPHRYRGTGHRHDQLYTYPARIWKKKRKAVPLPEVQLSLPNKEAESNSSFPSLPHVDSMHSVNSLESSSQETERIMNPVVAEPAPYKEYYDDWEDLDETPDAGEIDDRNSDSSDFEDSYIKKKKKKGKQSKGMSGGRGRKKALTPEEKELEDKEKPYSCDICGARYKTRPGLSYHLSHSHKKVEREEELPPPPPPPVPLPLPEMIAPPPPLPPPPQLHPPPLHPPVVTAGPSAEERSKASRYCDFCLGDDIENKKTGMKEELVSCADCGRSGHPSCLQFTANMIISVKKYPWQCIECKSCGLCGTSDNDDQLLFCDDCDRGYHMYCLNPPLSEPPEGSWSCHLCIREFYGGRKPAQML
ncbi:hypothetical protein CAPTEDRAFT_19718 [Capitella teleta]|uniref:Uncharacterized protein n=1 Tax=Capitella teleta TaxID=283909 RepID=R7TN23_CAPTE|nr:hypothetical protein CAPTEDRAFT_19718 [Capitella teleta]|eukprot:ELT95039.1 hypothetical protein CAPTEDRAFT_19718 [Capitella teleta]